MNTGFMGKGIITHDCLVRLDHHAGNAAYKPACGIYLLAYNMRINIQSIFPSPEYHNNLFKRGVSCPFSNPVYSALHLPCAIHDSSKGIGNRKAEVIMAMYLNNCLVYIRDIF